jgi:hypothetical protein
MRRWLRAIGKLGNVLQGSHAYLFLFACLGDEARHSVAKALEAAGLAVKRAIRMKGSVMRRLSG